MANLRVKKVNSPDSRTIKAIFTNNLHSSIGKNNVVVTSLSSGVPNPQINYVSVRENVLVVSVLPLHPFSKYSITFKSTDSVRFRSSSEQEFLLEDNKTNIVSFVGPEDPYNPIRDILVSFLKDNIYNLDHSTLVRNILNEVSTSLLRFRFDVGQAKNDNYLSFDVFNERKTRGYGPFDRLNEEGAFEITRLGLTEENARLSGSISFDSFPYDPVSLQRIAVSDEVLVSGITSTGIFDGFTLTVANLPVTKLLSVIIRYENETVYEYDISSYGYQIYDDKYDTVYAGKLVTLENNQFKLSEEVVNDGSFRIPGPGDEVIVSYEYKSLGRFVDDSSVIVSQIISIVRETAPALSTQFSLKKAPVVTAADNIPSLGGVDFLDPQSETPFLTIHPAFLIEVPFSLSGLPKSPGEYSIDYSTGRVYVYGAETNNGTGYFPPAMNYNYRKVFVDNLDYTYNEDTKDVVASPLRDLETQDAKISFNYEQTLVPDIDFKAGVHTESLNERIENRLKSSLSLQVLNTPITNVFKIFNETSSETYSVTRFNHDTVYFSANTPPRIFDKSRERAQYHYELNQTLFVDTELTNSSLVKVFKISLIDENIIASSEDCIGASFNSSVIFSRNDIFSEEVYFDGQVLSASTNIDRLNVGQYQVDYINGVVYVAVSDSQNENIGTVTYKKPSIKPKNPHIIAVENVYNSLSETSGVNKYLDYTSFEDNNIYQSIFDYADERFLNGEISLPYSVSGNNTITVTNNIKAIRHLYDAYDLNNNNPPIDFVEAATFSGNVITLDSVGVEKRETLTVGSGLTITVNPGSPGIELATIKSAIRVSDGYELVDGYQTILGDVVTLSAFSGGVVGDVVDVIYTVVLNTASTPIVDYNRGDLFIDYTYLADEIIVSYEYGDNSIDFRESSALEPGDVYYVSYKAGALRDSLLANFGSLIDIPVLRQFDIDLDRENYRHILAGAMQSFTKGPTIPSMKALVAEVTRIEPSIVESVFDVWSLGLSRLFPENFNVNGNPELTKGKFDYGLLCSQPGDSISFPISSNLKLESGTLEMFVIPQWKGLDNDATLTFSELQRNGVNILETQVFIGASSYNPTFSDGAFSVQKNDTLSPIGLPSAIHTRPTGFFIFYDEDNLKWKMLVKNQILGDVGDGYEFTGKIISSGGVYDVKSIPGLGEPEDSIRSGNNKINFSLNINSYDKSSPDGYSTADGYIDGYSFDGIQFMADDEHYLFDFAEESNKNRFSLYKDGRGYLSFSVWDNGDKLGYKPGRKSVYTVSADIQDWEAQEEHHVAISWSLNSYNRQDEMHLFIDGQETPNIIRYGGIPAAASTNRFRTAAYELLTGNVPKKIITNNDLTTVQGSAVVVSSTIDFDAAGILPGDGITIFENSFDSYLILGVSTNSLTLDENMPATLTDARFSVNPYSFIASTEIDIYKNIGVFRTDGYDGYETEIPGVRADVPGYSISKNAFNQNVLTILGPANVGDRIEIKSFGLNHRRCREKTYVWGSSSVLKTFLPPPINLDDVIIRSVILPIVPIGPDNATLVLGNWQATLVPTNVSNTTEGRTLEVRVTGGNVDFSTPTTVTFNGSSTGGATEVLTFTEPGIQYTTEKWMTISGIDIVTKPVVTSNNGVSIEIKERYTLTYPNGNNSYPVIRFAYQTQSGLSLEGDGSDIVTDANGFFPASDVGNLLEIVSPPSVAGIYEIVEKIDNQTVRLSSTLGSSFSGGVYGTYNISIGRSGFQNGFFFLEEAGSSNSPFYIPEGYYEFDYATYLQVSLNPLNQTAYIGSDFEGNKQADAVIDEFRILNYKLTDTRVGESLSSGDISVTTNSNTIRPFRKNNETLVLLHFDSLPPQNDVDYIRFTTREYVQSDSSVNSKFGQSIVITDKGLSFDNKGTLTTYNEGSIEFWVSPMFDTYNDPKIRVYFDAAAAVTEEQTSLTKGTVKTDGRISQVLSVRLAADENNTGKEFFNGGSISSDFRTINLNIPLPFQNTPVKVVYVPSGLQGDRLTIFKDIQGFITFNVRAEGTDIQVRQPVFWPRNTWHRIRATFKFNNTDNLDEIRLFIDGEERGTILFGTGFVFGQGFTFGQNFAASVTDQVLVTDINVTDHLSKFYIGSDFTGSNPAKARMDNIKLSNISLEPLIVGSQAKDVYYNANSEYIYPAIEDAFTTFLLDFDRITEKVEDFAILRDPEFGIFNFVLKIIDSFGILKDDPRVQDILEAMILALKPATSKVDIEYY